jgi:hypothetical protein
MDVFRLPGVVPGGKSMLLRRRHPPAYCVQGMTYNASEQPVGGVEDRRVGGPAR